MRSIQLIQLSELIQLIQLSELRECGAMGGCICLAWALLVALVRSMGLPKAICLAV